MIDRRKLTISIPGPLPAELSPNWQPAGGKGFWHKNSEAKAYQYYAYIEACDSRNVWEREHNLKWLPLEKATLQIIMQYQGRQKMMDDANLKGALKGAVDSLCCWTSKGAKSANFRAEIIRDDGPDCLTILKPKWVKGEAKVILEIEEDI